jgi:hypothetical protein
MLYSRASALTFRAILRAMKPYLLRLTPLDKQELQRVEDFVNGTLTDEQSQRIEEELKNRNDVHLLPFPVANKARRIARESWRQAILGPMFRDRTLRHKPTAVFDWTVTMALRGRATRVRMTAGVGIQSDYFQWLLVRAVANEQIARFVFCEYCGLFKFLKLSRKNVRFCSTKHRVDFHYYGTRRKDVAKNYAELCKSAAR